MPVYEQKDNEHRISVEISDFADALENDIEEVLDITAPVYIAEHLTLGYLMYVKKKSEKWMLENYDFNKFKNTELMHDLAEHIDNLIKTLIPDKFTLTACYDKDKKYVRTLLAVN